MRNTVWGVVCFGVILAGCGGEQVASTSPADTASSKDAEQSPPQPQLTSEAAKQGLIDYIKWTQQHNSNAFLLKVRYDDKPDYQSRWDKPHTFQPGQGWTVYTVVPVSRIDLSSLEMHPDGLTITETEFGRAAVGAVSHLKTTDGGVFQGTPFIIWNPKTEVWQASGLTDADPE